MTLSSNVLLSKRLDYLRSIRSSQLFQELKFIVSRRDCAVTNFLGYLSNLDEVDKDYPKIEFLKQQVDDLKKAVQDAKSRLLKKAHRVIKN